MKKYTFFYGGLFSQWYRSVFEHQGVTYCTAEQYMMAGKARLFGDKEILAKILATNNPYKQKSLGRKVKNFDVDVWNAISRDIVYEGSYAKYDQNSGLKEQLFNTAGTVLVEASPTDCLWGIGLAEGDPRCEDENQWRGVNWLGEVLTKVRDDLLVGKRSVDDLEWSGDIHIYEKTPPV